MDKNILFSVIMPVYNVEKYLAEAIESVLAQEYTNFELILVDDCTPDKSGDICDEYALKDSRITVIHKQQNEGLGYARNTGMEKASGDYVIFMDSDDWIEKDTLSKCKKYLEETPVDVLAFGFVRDYLNIANDVIKTEAVAYEQEIFADTPVSIAETAVKMDLQRNFAYAWSKIYSNKYLKSKGFLFDKTKLMEDFVFNIPVFENAGSVRVVTDIFYHYIKPVHETLASAYDASFFELCKMRYNKEYQLLKNGGVIEEYFYQSIRDIYIKHIFSVVLREKGKIPFKKRYAHTKDILNDAETVKVLSESKSSSKGIKALELIFKNKLALITVVMVGVYSLVKK